MGGHKLEVRATQHMEFVCELTWEGDWTKEEKEYSVSRLVMLLDNHYDPSDRGEEYTLETGLTREWDAEEKVLTYRYSYVADDDAPVRNNCAWSAYHPDITDAERDFGLNIGIGFTPYDGRVVSHQATICSVLMMERGTDTVYRKTYIAKGRYGLVDYFWNPFTMEKPNHTFKGWVTEEGELFDPKSTRVNSAMVVYADWEHPDGVLKNNDTYHWYECPDCVDVKLSDEELHEWDEGEITKEPTDTETGTKIYTCTVCNYKRTETIPAKGHIHDFGTEWESDENTHWHPCSGCDSKDAESVHDWNEGKVTKEPTDTETGIRTYTCTVCDHEKTEDIPAKGQSTEGGNTGNTGNDTDNKGDNNTGNDTDNKGDNNTGNDGNNGNDNTGNGTGNKDDNSTGNDNNTGNDTDDNSGNDATNNNDNNGENDSSNRGDNGNNVEDSSSDGNNYVGKEDAGNNTSTGTDVKTNAAGGSGEPKTGSTTYVEVYATVAMIAGLSYLLLYFMEDAGGISEEEKKEWISRIIRWAKKGGYIRKIAALAAIFVYLVYYYSMGKCKNITMEAPLGN